MRFNFGRKQLSIVGRRVAGLGLVAVLVAGSFPCVALADPQSELESARAQLEQIGSEYNSLQAQLDQAGRDLEETKGEIETNQQEIEQKQEELEGAQATLSERVSASYKSGNVDLLQVVLGATDFNDLISRVFYADKVVDADKKAIDEVKRIQDELDKKQDELQAKQDEQQKIVDDTNARLSELASQQQAASDLVNSLDAQTRQQLASEAQGNESLSGAIQAADDASNGQTDDRVDVADDNGGNSNSNGNSGSNSGSSSSRPSLPEASGGSPISIALQYAGAPYV